MRADYDSEADTVLIVLTGDPHADHADEVGERAIVAISDGRPVQIELLYPGHGVEEPLGLVAEKYNLDLEALVAAARSALAAPDRSVVLEIGLRS